MKRIGHFIETGTPGGAEQVMLDLCMHIKNDMAGFEPVIITFDHEWTINKCRELGIAHLSAPYRFLFKKTALLPLFGLFFAIWLRNNRIRLLHSHLFGPITGAAFATFLSRIPHIGTIHDIYMVAEKPVRSRLFQIASVLGTRLVTVSLQMQDFYRQYISNQRMQTIYNGIDTGKFCPPSSKAPEHTAESTVKIVCIGRLVPLKQVDRVIEVCERLLKTHDICLTIVGDGPDMDRLRQQGKNMEPGTQIRFVGQQADAVPYLQEADIFVQYSTTEGLSRSIIEAAACGLPCVVSDVGGNREIVIHNETGLVIDADDDDALLQSLARLADNRTVRKQYSAAARKHALAHFDASACNRRYQNLYNSFIH